tara:strand:+ start:202 stop:444 length:243 start_codon:yes stop_codon:yes gene_type:complete
MNDTNEPETTPRTLTLSERMKVDRIRKRAKKQVRQRKRGLKQIRAAEAQIRLDRRLAGSAGSAALDAPEGVGVKSPEEVE